MMQLLSLSLRHAVTRDKSCNDAVTLVNCTAYVRIHYLLHTAYTNLFDTGMLHAMARDRGRKGRND